MNMTVGNHETIMQESGEIWRKYNDILEVSNHGRVRTIDRIVHGKGYKDTITNRLIKGKIRKIQYQHSYPSIRDRKQFLRVHRMVAIAFIANPDNKPEVNHKDCNKLNAFYKNLEWTTHLENREHAVLNGRTPNLPNGTNHWNNKLDQTQVLTIRKCLSDGMTQQKLADYFKVHRTCISAIKLGYHWGHLE